MITKNAYAKINLTLEILEKRSDGYHNIRSVMQKVSLCDKLDFEFWQTGIDLVCDKFVCPPQDNLAYKAADLYIKKYMENTDKEFGVSIHITKNIPDKAGLAGGSADCACVLDTLYCEFGGVDYCDVEDIAASLGSDINFCLDKYRCALCTDRGIVLEKCRPFNGNVLICVPDAGMKTSDIYRRFDASPVYFNGNPSENVKKLLNSGKSGEIYPYVKNSFAPICESECTEISDIKDTMTTLGACACEMSGSGSSVFGIFDNCEKMDKAYSFLKEKYSKCFKCTSVCE